MPTQPTPLNDPDILRRLEHLEKRLASVEFDHPNRSDAVMDKVNERLAKLEEQVQQK